MSRRRAESLRHASSEVTLRCGVGTLNADTETVMSGRGDTAALACAVRGGDYVVDAAAVADAMLASGMFVATKPQHWLTFWVLDDEAGAFVDTA